MIEIELDNAYADRFLKVSSVPTGRYWDKL
jgi:hypothetical protein